MRLNYYTCVYMSQENTVDNCTDGMFEGIKYFISDAGRGKFVKLRELQPDKRYLINGPNLQLGSMVQCGDPRKVTQTSNPSRSDGVEDYARVQTVRYVYKCLDGLYVGVYILL